MVKKLKKFVIDCETGGICPKTCGLLSFTFKELNKKNVKTFYVKPNNKLDYTEEAFGVNKLSLKLVRKIGVSETQAIKEIISICDGNKIEIIGQNVSFDYNFLKELFSRHKKDINEYISYHLRETNQLAMFLNDANIYKFKWFGLSSIYETLFGKKFKDAHTSLGDVIATEKVYNKLMKILKGAMK